MTGKNKREALEHWLANRHFKPVGELIPVSPASWTEFYKLTMHPDKTIAWHALWTCERYCRKNPSFFAEKQHEIATQAMQCSHKGMKRLWLNMLLFLPVETANNVTFLDFCLQNMCAPHEPSAIQSVCMKLAYKLCCQNADLLNELTACLTNMELEYYTPAVQATHKNTLKSIIRLQHQKNKKTKNYV